MDTETKAKKAAILRLMHGYPSSQDRITAEVIEAYLDAVSRCSSDAVQRSCQQFARGIVPDHNNAFPPSASELAANAGQWDSAIAQLTADRELAKIERIIPYKIGEQPPPPAKPLGPTKLEINGRMTDVSHLTFEEKEIAIKTGALPAPAGNPVKLPNMRRI